VSDELTDRGGASAPEPRAPDPEATAAARRARMRLVEPLYSALEPGAPGAGEPASARLASDAARGAAPERSGPVWALALVACLPAAFVLAQQGVQLDGDTYHYIEYARKLAAGTPHTSSLHEAAPKPLPILLHGALHALTGSFAVLAWVWVALAGCAAALLARAAAALASSAAQGARVAWVAAALLAVHPLWVHQALGGSAVTLQVLCLALAARCALAEGARPVRAGLWLALAGLTRPDAWPIALACLLAAPLLALLCSCAERRGSALRLRPSAWAIAGGVGLLAVPLWLAFDRALTGDALFSFRSTASYAERHAEAEAARPLWLAALRYAPRLASNLAEALPGGLVLAALVGAAQLARRRSLAALTAALAALAVAAFYLLPFRSGLPLLPRFLVVPVAVAAGFAAHGVARLAPLVSRRLPRAALLAATLVVAAHSVRGLEQLSSDRCRLDAAATAGLLDALAGLPEAPTAERPLLVAARRKGLAVLALGVQSDAVTTLRHVAPEAWSEDPEAFGPIVYDPRDELEPYSSRWAAVLGAPEHRFAHGTELHSARPRAQAPR